jgi:hypothetical protein
MRGSETEAASFLNAPGASNINRVFNNFPENLIK